MAEYQVTFSHGPCGDDHITIDIRDRMVPSGDILARCVAEAVQLSRNAVNPPEAVTVNVNGSTLSGDDLARAVQRAASNTCASPA